MTDSISQLCLQIFQRSIKQYHLKDQIDQAFENPYAKDSFEGLLFQKNWIDTVQWHVEDLIRNPAIEATEALRQKRLIDQLNQERTNLVEYIDDHFLLKFKEVSCKADAQINTESPAWAIDRLSILQLKIYHMQVETERTDVSDAHRQSCAQKLAVLKEQEKDLCQSIDELLEALSKGEKKMKVYRQMKMYNDPNLNPILYGIK